MFYFFELYALSTVEVFFYYYFVIQQGHRYGSPRHEFKLNKTKTYLILYLFGALIKKENNS